MKPLIGDYVLNVLNGKRLAPLVGPALPCYTCILYYIIYRIVHKYYTYYILYYILYIIYYILYKSYYILFLF